jgi:hypothetical protein
MMSRKRVKINNEVQPVLRSTRLPKVEPLPCCANLYCRKDRFVPPSFMIALDGFSCKLCVCCHMELPLHWCGPCCAFDRCFRSSLFLSCHGCRQLLLNHALFIIDYGHFAICASCLSDYYCPFLSSHLPRIIEEE